MEKSSNLEVFEKALRKDTLAPSEVKKLYIIWNFCESGKLESEKEFLKAVCPYFWGYFHQHLESILREQICGINLEEFWEEKVLFLLNKVFNNPWYSGPYYRMLDDMSTRFLGILSDICVREVEEITKDLSDTKEPVLMITRLLKVYKRYDRFLTKFFRVQCSRKEFSSTYRNSGVFLMRVLNIVFLRTAVVDPYFFDFYCESLSLAMSSIIIYQSKTKEKEEQQFVHVMGVDLEDIFHLFNTHHSELFLKYYERFLRKRLFKESSSVVIEEAMVGKLKLRFGSSTVSRMSVMINDVKKNRKLRDEISLLGKDNSFEFSPRVLTNGWSMIRNKYISENLCLPQFLKKRIDSFKEIWMKGKEGRKIYWNWCVSEAIISMYGKIQCEDNDDLKLKDDQEKEEEEEEEGENIGEEIEEIELRCSTLQMVILSLFNENDSMTMEEICNILGLLGDPTMMDIVRSHVVALGPCENEHNGVLLIRDVSNVIINEDFCSMSKYVDCFILLRKNGKIINNEDMTDMKTRNYLREKIVDIPNFNKNRCGCEDECLTGAVSETSSIKFVVKTLSGVRRTIKLPKNHKIECVKRILEERTGISKISQRLVFQGKILCDDKKLGEIEGLGDGSTIQLIQQLKGKKPVILIYPKREIKNMIVKIILNTKFWKLSHVYPKPADFSSEKEKRCVWKLDTVHVNGMIETRNTKGRLLKVPYLFWESVVNEDYFCSEDVEKNELGRMPNNSSVFNFDFRSSNEQPVFCMTSEIVTQFLEKYLDRVGMKEKDICDFITFWISELEEKKYVTLQFLSEKKYDKLVQLEITKVQEEKDHQMNDSFDFLRYILFMIFKTSDSRNNLDLDQENDQKIILVETDEHLEMVVESVWKGKKSSNSIDWNQNVVVEWGGMKIL